MGSAKLHMPYMLRARANAFLQQIPHRLHALNILHCYPSSHKYTTHCDFFNPLRICRKVKHNPWGGVSLFLFLSCSKHSTPLKVNENCLCYTMKYYQKPKGEGVVNSVIVS